MATRKRRYLGCLGIIVLFAVFLFLANFAFSLYYRHQSSLIGREMAKKGYPETFEELVAKQNEVPPGQRNGATDFLDAFKLFNDEGVNYDFIPKMAEYVLPPPGTPIPPEAMKAMNQMLDQNAGMLGLISRGLSEEVCRFPVDLNSAEEFMLFPIDWGKHIRNTARLIRVRAIYAGESGDIDAAIASVCEILEFGGRFADQPSFNPLIHNHTVLDMGFEASTELIERGYVSSPDDLARLEDAISSVKIGDYVYALWTDTLTSEWAWSQIPGFGQITKSYLNEPAAGIEDLVQFGSEYLRFLSSLRDRNNYLARKIVGDPKNPLNKPTSSGPMSTDPVEALRRIAYPIVLSDRLAHARRCNALLAVRTVRFMAEKSKLPSNEEFATLAQDCPDPFGGQPMRYRPTDNGFLIYSVGSNGRDDGGLTHEDLKSADDKVVEIRLPR